MKLSIFTSMTNPEERKDPWEEALRSYEDIADEVITVGQNWPPGEFEWKYIGEVFQEGHDICTGDWVMRMDIDYILHEKDMDYIRKFIKDNDDAPAIAFPRYQFFYPGRYQMIAYLCVAVNKKRFPNIKLNGGGDMLLPALDGNLIDPLKMPKPKAAIWNYECMFKTKDIISKERARFARAWFRTFDHWTTYGGGTEEVAFAAWMKLISERLPKHINKIKLSDHPKYIQEKLENLEPEQFGYDCFGLMDSFKPDYKEFAKSYLRKIKY